MRDVAKKSRSAAAFMSGMTSAKPAEAENEGKKAGPTEVVGAWAVEGRTRLRERFEEVEEEARKANEVQYGGILAGQIPILISPDKISDIVGTDRILNAEDLDDVSSFNSLVSNIKQRGQRVPIRVRPIDSDWRPNAATPRDVTGMEFALQSGRRRLAACKSLGLDVLCFLSFSEEGMERLDDLQERFYENTVRRDLTIIERLYSIGLIAKETPGISQSQLSEIIGVNRSTVNRACGVVEYYSEIGDIVDLETATRDDIDAALKMVRSKSQSDTNSAKRAKQRREAIKATSGQSPLPFRRKETKGGTVTLSRSRADKMVVKIESATIPDEVIAEILKIMETSG